MPLSRKIIFSNNDCINSQSVKFDSYFDGAVLQRGKTNLIYGEGFGNLKFYCNGKEYAVTSNGKYWRVELPPMPAGGPYSLQIVGNGARDSVQAYFGDVFLLSGQSNMEWTMKQCSACEQVADETLQANDSLIRLFNIHCDFCNEQRDELKEKVKWTSAAVETVTDFSCLGYLFGKYYKRRVNVPVGLVATAVGGTSITFWQKREAQARLTERGVEIFTDVTQPIYTPTIGYNALINPLTAHSYKAVLWYQGESNTANEFHYGSYRQQLVALIKSWRDEFDDSSLQFVLFQLARFRDNRQGFCEVNRQIDEVAASTEGCCVVPNSDLGEWDNIHPNDKVTPAKRAVESILSLKR